MHWSLALLLLFGALVHSQTPPTSPWERLSLNDTGRQPGARWGHTGLWCGTPAGVLIFGGQGVGGTLHDDAWLLEPRQGWIPVQISGDHPRARIHHAGVCTVSREFVVFGGACGHSCVLDDLWLLTTALGPGDSRTGQWTRLPQGGTSRPSARSGHVAALSGHTLYVFGGQQLVGGALLDDAWSYSLLSHTWDNLVPAGTDDFAQGRRDAAAVWFEGGMHIIGGAAGLECVRDVIRLDLSLVNASLLEGGGQPPSARRLHAAAGSSDADEIVMFGGVNDDDEENEETWRYSSAGWEKLSVGATTPGQRTGASLAWVPDSTILILVGGSRYRGRWEIMDDVWELDLDKTINYDRDYRKYLKDLRRERSDNETRAATEAEDERNLGNDLQVDLSWLDNLFLGMPVWAAAMIIFGIPGCCLLSCCISGCYRQRRRALARKRAEARERSATQ